MSLKSLALVSNNKKIRRNLYVLRYFTFQWRERERKKERSIVIKPTFLLVEYCIMSLLRIVNGFLTSQMRGTKYVARSLPGHIFHCTLINVLLNFQHYSSLPEIINNNIILFLIPLKTRNQTDILPSFNRIPHFRF